MRNADDMPIREQLEAARGDLDRPVKIF